MARPELRFYHRIALAWGCSVDEMLGRLTSRQLTELRCYHDLEPFGDDHRPLARITAAVLNTCGPEEPYSENDFLPAVPEFDDDDDDPLATAEFLAAAFARVSGSQVQRG